MKLNPRRTVFVFFSLPLCLPSHFFFAYLCCSQCLSWSGKSEVIGFCIKESKQEWKQALIHFTLSRTMGWQETLENSSKRAFTLNFLRQQSAASLKIEVLLFIELQVSVGMRGLILINLVPLWPWQTLWLNALQRRGFQLRWEMGLLRRV